MRFPMSFAITSDSPRVTPVISSAYVDLPWNALVAYQGVVIVALADLEDPLTLARLTEYRFNSPE